MAKPWFAPKRFGYGAGVPISWEGWAVLAGFLVCTILVLYLPQRLFGMGLGTTLGLCGLVLVSAVFVAIAKAKTDGAWRWRNGEGP